MAFQDDQVHMEHEPAFTMAFRDDQLHAQHVPTSTMVMEMYKLPNLEPRSKSTPIMPSHSDFG